LQDAPLALGLDLGGTQVRAALLRDGQVMRRAARPTDVAGGPEAVMQQFEALAAEVAGDLRTMPVKAVGLSAPGPLDTVEGVVDHMPTLPGWEGFPLRQRLSALFGLPALVENDGIAAAHGEWRHGAGQSVSNLVYATISTGIGGGAIVDGRLLHGRRGMAAHIGHFRLAMEGPVCACGGIGCFEAFASGSALGRRAREAASADPGGWLGRTAQSQSIDGQILDARHVVEGARAGDLTCVALIRDEARYLGIGFTGLAHLFSPELIVMGGGVSQAFDLLAVNIHETIRREAWSRQPSATMPASSARLRLRSKRPLELAQ
jgi:glucokinase